MSDCYLVDEYCNAIRKRSAENVAREQQLSYFRRNTVFATEVEATKFILDRARMRVETARKELTKASNQLKKWSNLYQIRMTKTSD